MVPLKAYLMTRVGKLMLYHAIGPEWNPYLSSYIG
jgi:hypothetical protein